MKTGMLICLSIGLLVGVSSCGLRIIEDGEAGIKFDLGKISDNAIETGWHFYNRFITKIEKWNIKTQEIKQTMSIPSSGGLVSTLDVSVIYQTQKKDIIAIRKLIGSEYRNVILVPYIREAVRNIVSGYGIKALYSEKERGEISKKILEFLISKQNDKGIQILDVLLRDVSLPKVFSDSIEIKLKTEQESLAKEFELTKAKKDAEISVAKAQGVAESNKIIADSITENYLRWMFIENLKSNEKQIIYVPTEANLPILEAQRK